MAMVESGISEQEAQKKIWMVDKFGLLFKVRCLKLGEAKECRNDIFSLIFKTLSIFKMVSQWTIQIVLVGDLPAYSQQKSSSLKLLSFIKPLALYSNCNLCVGTKLTLSCFSL